MNLEIYLEACDQTVTIARTETNYSYHPEAELAVDPNKYDGATYYFEAVWQISSGQLSMLMVNPGTEAGHSTEAVNLSTITTITRQRSNAFTPPHADTWRPAINGSSGTPTGTVYSLRWVIVQANATRTQLQIAIGTSASGKYTSYANPSNWGQSKRKAWYYDSSKFVTTGATTVIMEAILACTKGYTAYACVKAWDGTSAVTNGEASFADSSGGTITRSQNTGGITLSSGTAYEGDYRCGTVNKTTYVYAVRLIITIDSANLSQYTTDGNQALTTNTQRVGENVTNAASITIKKVEFKLYAIAGSTGTCYCRIRKVSDDSQVAVSSDWYSIASLTTDTAGEWKSFTFNASLNYSYYVEVDMNLASGTGINVLKHSAGTLSGGVFSYYDGSSWTDTAGADAAVRIWLGSDGMTAVESIIRVGWEETGTTTSDECRMLYTATNHGGSRDVYFEATGYETATDADNDIDLRDDGTNDSGTGGASVTNSPVNFNSTTPVRVRSAAI